MRDKFSALVSQSDKKMNDREIAYLSACFREIIFTILHDRGTGHWGGASSAMDIVTALYFNRLNINPRNPQDEERDRFVLSKGHACLSLYSNLAYRGYFSPDDLPTFRVFGSHLQGHPAMLKLPGVDMSAGALGHGIPVAIGMAEAARLSNKNYMTYVMVGEGCLNEGASWEALLFASKMKTKNLVLLVDHNKVQLDGTEEEILPLSPLKDKLVSFGWHVGRLYDGHDTKDILESFKWIDSDDIWPKAIIYETVKGAKISFSEGKNTWHGCKVDDEHYSTGILELKKDADEKEALI